MSTGQAVVVLPEVGGWMLDTDFWPLRLVLSWVTPESQPQRSAQSCEEGGIPQTHSKAGTEATETWVCQLVGLCLMTELTTAPSLGSGL